MEGRSTLSYRSTAWTRFTSHTEILPTIFRVTHRRRRFQIWMVMGLAWPARYCASSSDASRSFQRRSGKPLTDERSRD